MQRRNRVRVIELSEAVRAAHDGTKSGPKDDRIVAMTYELSRLMKECLPGGKRLDAPAGDILLMAAA